eukprot:TRINITY_DN8724_c1_g2_i1.p2 TRINITY_DN8724_c1_g2~~TRINITY_DN8724_c1_g2_i1.p2  ORF type:complete len:195 (+),score=64.11 TRINITY_DN8724_c1_g2_i1:61-585(+)
MAEAEPPPAAAAAPAADPAAAEEAAAPGEAAVEMAKLFCANFDLLMQPLAEVLGQTREAQERMGGALRGLRGSLADLGQAEDIEYVGRVFARLPEYATKTRRIAAKMRDMQDRTAALRANAAAAARRHGADPGAPAAPEPPAPAPSPPARRSGGWGDISAEVRHSSSAVDEVVL